MTFEVHDGDEQIAMQEFDEWEAACKSTQRLLNKSAHSVVLQTDNRVVLRAWEISKDGVRQLTR